MKWSFASVGLIVLGLIGIQTIMLFNDITVSNEQDYYTLKYATEASMLEAVDVAYYRLTGDIKISQEKFVENFTRRFTETSTFGQGNYGVAFYQIIESPAKVSLRIYDKTSGYNIYTYDEEIDTTQPDVVNSLSAILDGTKLEIKNESQPEPIVPNPPPTVPPVVPPNTPPTPPPPTVPSVPNTITSGTSSTSIGGARILIIFENGQRQYVNSLAEANQILINTEHGDGGHDNVYYESYNGEKSLIGTRWRERAGINLTNGTCLYCVELPSSGSSGGGGSVSSGASSGSGKASGGGSKPSSGGSGKSGGGGGKTCFLAGTQVMTIDGYKDIDRLKIGDLVLTYNEGTGNNEYHRVTNLFAFSPEVSKENLLTLTFDDKTTLKVSSTHRFYIIRNNEVLWLPANEITTSDRVMYSDKTYHRVINVETQKLNDYVYNISVENAHNFYVSNQQILVHNLTATPMRVVK